MTRLLKITLAAFLLIFLSPLSHAAENNETHVKIRLLAEQGQITPGQDIAVAIEQSIESGWHTYWKNPGDSGAAPQVTWKLPDGFKISDIEWPAPHKLPLPPLLNYGYEDNAVLLQTLTVPENIPEGPITLSAHIDILVCREICIPESGAYTLTLNDPAAGEEDNTAWFKAARAKLPVISATPATFHETGGNVVIEASAPGPGAYDYIPAEWGIVENSAPAIIVQSSDKIVVTQKRGERALSEITELPGLLLVKGDNPQAYAFTAKPSAAPASASIPGREIAPSFIFILGFALLGGLLLNLMPCVFPVLSIKALSLVKTAQNNPARARLFGIFYTLGIIASFIAIAALLYALKAGGSQIGWGFQLQNPEIVTGLAYLLFIIGLNFSGVFEIGHHFGNFGNRLTQGDTPVHSFFTGVLATLVATPCTAPFMAGALGFALVQPFYTGMLVFAVLGLGLALPYLALSFIPALQKILPRPGAWMESFRQLLAFPMYASSAWLVWVVSQQAGPMGVFAALMGLVFIAFAIWLLRHMPVTKTGHAVVKILAVVSLLAALYLVPGGTQDTRNGPENFGEPWSAEKLEILLRGPDPVFVEMTAAWCITCKVNHAVAIDIESTRRIFAERNVKYLIGDWTNEDPEITRYLASFDRNGVPIYVYYGPPGENGKRPDPVILPQLLTPGIVAQTLTAP